jgi:Ferritin-like domain
MRSAERSRREVVKSAAAALAGGAIPFLVRTAGADAQSGGEAEIVESAIVGEQAAAVAYGSAAENRLLAKPLADSAALFRAQARAHAAALGRELRALGGEPPAPPRPDQVKGLIAVRTEEDFLLFTLALESANVRRYLEGLQALQTPVLVERLAQIMASAGQHLVILRQALSADPADWVPDAFETGTSPPPA